MAIDLDPQANLTSSLQLPEEKLEELWDPELFLPKPTTIYRCIQPLMEVGDIQEPITQRIRSTLHIVPGDLALAGFEDFLSQEWPNSLGSGNLLRAFRVLTAFWTVAQKPLSNIRPTLSLLMWDPISEPLTVQLLLVQTTL